MSPYEAGRLSTHLRRLRAVKIIDVYDFAVADTMLWRLRRPGFDNTRASYTSIAKLAGVCRDKVQKAIAKLITLRIFTKTKKRIVVRWGWNQCFTASRQDVNIYTWSTEAVAPPVKQEKASQQGKEALKGRGVDLLALRRAAFEAQQWRTHHAQHGRT